MGYALLESDRRYFELGAQKGELTGASLAWMPGLVGMASGCVVQRLSAGDVEQDPEGWLREAEHALRELGSAMHRIYSHEELPRLGAVLERHGYRRREEVASVCPASIRHSPDGIRLRPVVSDADWGEKLALHREVPMGPDGYASAAADWVELERRKCADGGEMSAYLVTRDGAVVGAIGAIELDGLVRVKNLVVHRARRREGIAGGAVLRLAEHAHESGRRLGTFAVPGGEGDKVYRALGFEPVAIQFEWMKAL